MCKLSMKIRSRETLLVLCHCFIVAHRSLSLVLRILLQPRTIFFNNFRLSSWVLCVVDRTRALSLMIIIFVDKIFTILFQNFDWNFWTIFLTTFCISISFEECVPDMLKRWISKNELFWMKIKINSLGEQIAFKIQNVTLEKKMFPVFHFWLKIYERLNTSPCRYEFSLRHVIITDILFLSVLLDFNSSSELCDTNFWSNAKNLVKYTEFQWVRRLKQSF